MKPNTPGTVTGPGWRAPGVVLRVLNGGGTVRYARPGEAEGVHVFMDDGGVWCEFGDPDVRFEVGETKP